MAASKVLGKINLSTTAFLCCDMQEKFRPAIKYFTEIITVSKRLISTSQILKIPLLVTEQYPKGLGNTVTELDISGAVKVVPKTQFTMAIDEVTEELIKLKIKHIVLFGIETQVCILQTVIDLLSLGYDVHVVADGVSSRSQVERKLALERFRSLGATVTTCETVLFQLLGDAKHPHFKEVQALVKTIAPDSDLV